LDDAEKALQSLHEVLAKDDTGKDKLAFVEYELGYVNFLQADVDLAISYFRNSYSNALAGGDPVGAWIGKCLNTGRGGFSGVRRVLPQWPCFVQRENDFRHFRCPRAKNSQPSDG